MFDEDLAQFFDFDDFAIEITITPKSGVGAYTIPGIMDSPYLEGALGQFVYHAEKPTVLIRSDSLQHQWRRGDTVEFAGRTHQILVVREEGAGTSTMELTRYD